MRGAVLLVSMYVRPGMSGVPLGASSCASFSALARNGRGVGRLLTTGRK